MIIATRTLHLQHGERDVDVPIRIFAPETDGSAWSCGYEIDWPEGTRRSTVYGVDAVQALELALRTIGTEIYISEYHKSKLLRWEKPSQGYGFPVPNSLRDLLDGDDARFF